MPSFDLIIPANPDISIIVFSAHSAGISGKNVCYWVESKVLFYSEKQYADEDPDGEYGEHTRCTFYGIESSDFDVADENEILSLLGV